MYGIYANIWGILMVNVTIYSSTMDPSWVILYHLFIIYNKLYKYHIIIYYISYIKSYIYIYYTTFSDHPEPSIQPSGGFLRPKCHWWRPQPGHRTGGCSKARRGPRPKRGPVVHGLVATLEIWRLCEERTRINGDLTTINGDFMVV